MGCGLAGGVSCHPRGSCWEEGEWAASPAERRGRKASRPRGTWPRAGALGCCSRRLLQRPDSCLPPSASVIFMPILKTGFPVPPPCRQLQDQPDLLGRCDGPGTHRACTHQRFWVKSRTFPKQVYGAFANACPAVARGREAMAQGHAGEGVWTTGRERLPLLAVLARGLGLRAPRASPGLRPLRAFLRMLWPACCSRARSAAAEHQGLRFRDRSGKRIAR